MFRRVFIAKTCAFRTRVHDMHSTAQYTHSQHNTYVTFGYITLHRSVEIEINKEKRREDRRNQKKKKNVMFETDDCMPIARLFAFVVYRWLCVRSLLAAAFYLPEQPQ